MVWARGIGKTFIARRDLWRLAPLLAVLFLHPARALLLLETETQWNGAAPELVLVSFVLNGRDLNQDAILAFDPLTDEAYVDAREFAAALNLGYKAQGKHVEMTTPIGSALFESRQWRELDGRIMLSLKNLGEGLASDINFSQRNYAVQAQVPWRTDAPVDPAEVIRPGGSADVEIDAPKASLSFIRSEYLHRIQGDADTSTVITDTGGRLFNGFWRTRVRDYIEDDPFFEDYAWLQSGAHHRLLIGNQTLSLDPLLKGFEFTGAQGAWSNRSIGLFTDALQAEQLITNQRGSIRTFIGEGPAGGRAELRIEGVAVAETIISLDGRYEFRDVELPAGAVVEVEAWLYQRGNSGVPDDIESFSGYNTNRVLPGNTLLFQGGFGVDGNLIEDARGELDAAGFFTAYYAPVDGLTVEGMYQRLGGQDSALTGVSANLDRFGFISAQLAYSGSDHAWRVEAENTQKHWFWRGFTQSEPDGWFGREGDLDDIFGELGYRFNSHWRLSLIGRDFQSNDDDFDYLLPAAEWRPTNHLTFRARPDFDGDYMAQAFWRINRAHTLSGIYNEAESSMQWRYNLPNRDNLLVQALDRDQLGQRVSAIYRHASGGLRSLGWALGLLVGESSVGFLAQGNYEFVPGLRFRGEVFRDPFSGVLDDSPDTVVTLSLVANFNFAGGRISRGHFRRELLDMGTVSGRIAVPEGFNDAFDLSGVAVMVNNQIRTRTELNGRFSVPFLAPGIYRVKLDLDGLPLELQPENDAYWVEVAAGAASYVNFTTDVRLGFAGQIKDPTGCVFAGEVVEVLQQGKVAQRIRSNDFGYYRVDDLAPGNYQIRAADHLSHEHTVQLSRGFLFGQDIVLPVSANCGQESEL